MTPRIEIISQKKLVGLGISTSIAENKTVWLWRNFMSRKKEINHTSGTNLFSIEIYQPGYFNVFDIQAVFEKWAAVEVNDLESIPDGFEIIVIPPGSYAVFTHIGLTSEGIKTFQYIFSEWMPNSPYEIDSRPHFEIMGEKYSNTDPGSEEEFWIPVKLKE